ncbi:MAG: transcriptional regulator [Candidatus Micrarchaeota archaeon]
MDARLPSLIREAGSINSKIMSMPRLLILVSLEQLGEDGATFRELKAGLELPDGVLFSNLKVLMKMGYLIGRDVIVEGKSMSAYSITAEGMHALSSVKIWLSKWLKGDVSGKIG